MRRIYSRPKGAPINDPRIGQPMWSKPGTVLDKVAKALRTARPAKVHQHRREIERNMRRMPDDGFGRVPVARVVGGSILHGAIETA